VTSDPLSFVESLDGIERCPDPEFLSHQAIGSAVIMPLELEMVVDVEPHLLPASSGRGIIYVYRVVLILVLKEIREERGQFW
jgi:hypothetical protein